MKKKSKKLIIILSILLIVLTLGMGGYSYAKYITEVKGNGEMSVAKWSFKVNDGSTQFSTIKLSDTVDASKLVDGKIAPGTGGEFTIKIDGTGSDVGIKYSVNFENEQNKPTNLIFKYNNKSFKSLSGMKNYILGTIEANSADKVRNIQIQWEWPYETEINGVPTSESDEKDTQEGINALDYSFDVVVTGTQISK